jgi:hypothetical protein
MLGDRLLMRMDTLDGVNVISHATATPNADGSGCKDSDVVMRGYQLTYRLGGDVDTHRAQLQSVHVVGQAGTPENSTPLPIATYSYGTATSGGMLQYQRSPDGAAQGLRQPYTAADNLPITLPTLNGFSTFTNLLDVTGDGLADVVTSSGDNPLLIDSDWIHSATVHPLSDQTLTRGPIEIRQLDQVRYQQQTNIDLVWRQAIDVNGDGRIDFVDAAEEEGHWVVYLNMPDLSNPSTAQWQRRSYSTQAVQAALTARNLTIDVPNHIPLARHSTQVAVTQPHCWSWSVSGQTWIDHVCGLVQTQQMTFTEWEISDINGDGYPDVVMNSSPIATVHVPAPRPEDPTDPKHPATAHSNETSTPTLAATNEIDALFNVLGVRFDVNSPSFSPPVTLRTNDTCGVAIWSATVSSQQSLTCDIVDVNGDGIADRVTGRSVYFGTGTLGAGGFFTPVAPLTLPGSLAVQNNDEVAICSAFGSNGLTQFTTYLRAGLRDLTGDGIPDYVDQDSSNQWRVAIGTGMGFLPPIPINGGFALSSQSETCAGTISTTTTGLYDVDGDGKPDIVTADAFVNKLVGSAGVLGAPEAGRLTTVDNGFGATTSITYRSAKLLLDPSPSARAVTSLHQVPFPEIVVASVQTTLPHGPNNTNRNLAPMQYAYGGAPVHVSRVPPPGGADGSQRRPERDGDDHRHLRAREAGRPV